VFKGVPFQFAHQVCNVSSFFLLFFLLFCHFVMFVSFLPLCLCIAST
jgi:hypothetical protein